MHGKFFNAILEIPARLGLDNYFNGVELANLIGNLLSSHSHDSEEDTNFDEDKPIKANIIKLNLPDSAGVKNDSSSESSDYPHVQ